MFKMVMRICRVH